LRLRQIDLLGVQYGADVALTLAAARPELVRRLILAGTPTAECLSAAKQLRLMLDIADFRVDPFGVPAQTLVKQIDTFLRS
jgi:pimeloyl-ACP methyl ester carboxylesterase